VFVFVKSNLQLKAYVGNVLKYIKRAGKKSEDPIADLQKAATYIDMEIRRLKQELSEPHEDFSL